MKQEESESGKEAKAELQTCLSCFMITSSMSSVSSWSCATPFKSTRETKEERSEETEMTVSLEVAMKQKRDHQCVTRSFHEIKS